MRAVSYLDMKDGKMEGMDVKKDGGWGLHPTSGNDVTWNMALASRMIFLFFFIYEQV